MSDQEIRLGVIGIGNMGSAHAKNVAVKHEVPGLQVTAVADVRPAH